jgi:hypothetical protein
MFDYDPPKQKEPVDYTGLKIGAALLPVFFLITFLSNADMALAAVIVLGMIIFAIKLRWYLRKHLWFWVVIVVHIGAPCPIGSVGSMASRKYTHAFLHYAIRNRGFSDHLGGLRACRKALL